MFSLLEWKIKNNLIGIMQLIMSQAQQSKVNIVGNESS